jgi:hypothetical protein
VDGNENVYLSYQIVKNIFMVMWLQITICDMAKKTALDHCSPGGRCALFLSQHMHKVEHHASSIAQQLLKEECKLVAGQVDSGHQHEPVQLHKGGSGGMLLSNQAASLQVSLFLVSAACMCRGA